MLPVPAIGAPMLPPLALVATLELMAGDRGLAAAILAGYDGTPAPGRDIHRAAGDAGAAGP